MKRIFIALAILVALGVVAGAAVFYLSREQATVPVEEGYGATHIPTDSIAPANPWLEDTEPTPAA